MLYGKHPYKASSLTKLVKKIKEEPLNFPEEVHITEPTKNLLQWMLVFDKTKRISWEELFDHKVC